MHEKIGSPKNTPEWARTLLEETTAEADTDLARYLHTLDFSKVARWNPGTILNRKGLAIFDVYHDAAVRAHPNVEEHMEALANAGERIWDALGDLSIADTAVAVGLSFAFLLGIMNEILKALARDSTKEVSEGEHETDSTDGKTRADH